ncbi:MAG TPA: oligosaccharide flippase family protein [Solirubrobacteraceae bacterium]|nr:oligosaccharide flippase family protein [Solirubrobacteraceae bacterium]
MAQARVLTRNELGQLARQLREATFSAELRRGVAAGVLLYGGGVVARVVSEVVFARTMGPREFGAYSYVFSWLSILAIAGTLGVAYAFVRFVPEYEVAGNFDGLRRLVRFARVSSVAFGAAVALLAGAVLALARPSGVGLAAVLIGMATVPVLTLFTTQTELARSLRRIVLAFLPFFVLRSLFTVGFALALLVAGTGLSAAQGLAVGLAAIVVCLILQRERLRAALAAHPQPTVAAPSGDWQIWLRVALPFLALNLLATTTMRADVIVVALVRGAASAGVYAAAAKVALLAIFALEALNTIVAPTISKLFYAGDLDGVRRVVRNSARVTFAAALCATLVLEIAGSRSLSVFGSGYGGGMLALQVLLVGQVINASTGPVTYLMAATGHQRLAAIAQAVSTCVFFVAVIPLTRVWGIAGTALAVTLARATINIWMALAAQQKLHVRAFVV